MTLLDSLKRSTTVVADARKLEEFARHAMTEKLAA